MISSHKKKTENIDVNEIYSLKLKNNIKTLFSRDKVKRRKYILKELERANNAFFAEYKF